MYDAELRRTRDLKRRSRSLRDQGDYDSAASLLDQSIGQLKTLLESADQALRTGVAASPDVRDLAAELADCYGSLGGVRRRQADTAAREQRAADAAAAYTAAVAAYERGAALEQDDRFRMANSYNMVQHVVVSVLTWPESIADAQLQKRLRDAWASIQRQIDTTRSGDAWALSDLALVQLLSGDAAAADRTWDRMDDLQPQRNVYTSGLPVLEALAKALQDPRCEAAAERFRSFVPTN